MLNPPPLARAPAPNVYPFYRPYINVTNTRGEKDLHYTSRATKQLFPFRAISGRHFKSLFSKFFIFTRANFFRFFFFIFIVCLLKSTQLGINSLWERTSDVLPHNTNIHHPLDVVYSLSTEPLTFPILPFPSPHTRWSHWWNYEISNFLNYPTVRKDESTFDFQLFQKLINSCHP